MRGVEIYRIISAGAQMQQARALNTQSQLLQSQLKLQAEQVNLQRREADLALLEKQGRQYLVDMEFQFDNLCKLNKSYPLYSLYTCERFLHEIISSNYFQELFRNMEDMRMVRVLAQRIEENVSHLKKEHSKVITHEYQFFSQGLNNMFVINETLELSDSMQRRKENLVKQTETFQKSQKITIFGSLFTFFLGLTCILYGWHLMFSIPPNDIGFLVLFLGLCGCIGPFVFSIPHISGLKTKIKSSNINFRKKKNLIAYNCQLLDFQTPDDMKKWVEEHSSFFEQRVPSN